MNFAHKLHSKKDLENFNLSFNAKQYIKDTGDHFFLSPDEWIQGYQTTIDSFIRVCVVKAQKILINNKYIIFSLPNNNRFYKLYKENYDEMFDLIDKHLHQEQMYINAFVATKIKEYQTKEVH